METHSAATRASSKTKEKKTKAHATPKCSGKKETAGTVINTKGVPEVKDKAEAKVAVVAKIAVDSVMVSVAKSAVEPSMVKDTEKEKANAKKNIGTNTINSNAISSDNKDVPITIIDSHAKDAKDAAVITNNSKVKDVEDATVSTTNFKAKDAKDATITTADSKVKYAEDCYYC
jgi:hypothetical protein